MNLALVCVAGGSGRRFGRDKLAEPFGESTVLQSSLAALRAAFPEAPLVLVLPADRLANGAPPLVQKLSPSAVVAGGDRRQDSVRHGCEEAACLGADTVAVHDGARPMVHPEDVRRVVRGLGAADGAVLCGPVADTVKRVGADGRILETLPRGEIRLAQTPQVFRLAALERAWSEGDFEREWTDEAALLENLGMRVIAVVAENPNPKVTTENDLEVLRALRSKRG